MAILIKDRTFILYASEEHCELPIFKMLDFLNMKNGLIFYIF